MQLDYLKPPSEVPVDWYHSECQAFKNDRKEVKKCNGKNLPRASWGHSVYWVLAVSSLVGLLSSSFVLGCRRVHLCSCANGLSSASLPQAWLVYMYLKGHAIRKAQHCPQKVLQMYPSTSFFLECYFIHFVSRAPRRSMCVLISLVFWYSYGYGTKLPKARVEILLTGACSECFSISGKLCVTSFVDRSSPCRRVSPENTVYSPPRWVCNTVSL